MAICTIVNMAKAAFGDDEDVKEVVEEVTELMLDLTADFYGALREMTAVVADKTAAHLIAEEDNAKRRNESKALKQQQRAKKEQEARNLRAFEAKQKKLEDERLELRARRAAAVVKDKAEAPVESPIKLEDIEALQKMVETPSPPCTPPAAEPAKKPRRLVIPPPRVVVTPQRPSTPPAAMEDDTQSEPEGAHDYGHPIMQLWHWPKVVEVEELRRTVLMST